MLSLPEPVKIFLCVAPADMRRSFDGLSNLVREWLQADPLSGHLFVFRNRRGDRVKLLYWDRDGLVLYYKRLEEGTYRFPTVSSETRSVQVTAQELSLLLWGIDPASVRRQKRYSRPAG
jgi:transposase